MPAIPPQEPKETDPLVRQARRMRPPSGPTDRRRLLAAGLSAVLPGLGQLANHQAELGRRFLLPTLAAVGAAWLVVQLVPLPRLAATFVSPTMLTLLLGLNVLVFAWRVAAVGQAFFDERFRASPGRVGGVGLVAILVFVAAPHFVGLQLGLTAQGAFGRIFESGAILGATSGPQLADRDRVNVLLIGLDSTPWRTATLTDTMMVASLDPVGRTISLVSLPRDLVDVPLGNGDVYGPKLNSLMSYADRHPDDFPGGGREALREAVAALLDVPIHYTATMDFVGFVKMIDAVGGVDIAVAEGFTDPAYDGYGLAGPGWSVEAGPNHFDGMSALAYVRSRKAEGETDFTRQTRQQEILLALREKFTAGGSLVFALPDLLEALGDTVRTDFPVDRLPAMAAIADEISADRIVRVVIRFPLVGGTTNRYGSVQVPNITAIQSMAQLLFGPPGTRPIPWPTPDPTPQPARGAPGVPRTSP